MGKHTDLARITSATALLLGAALFSGCGGGSNSSGMAQSMPPPAPPPVAATDPQYRVSGDSPFAANCDGVPPVGAVYTNAEVEPTLAFDPANASSMIAAWQQDRWSSGGARGLLAARSVDGGHSWSRQAMPFTRCGGGTPANGGDYERGSDAWLSMGPTGTAHQIAIVFSGGLLEPGAVSAVVASRSTDGGATWAPTQTLIRDTENFFNDKCTITADPVTPKYVYAVWDRLFSETSGPTEFVRSADDGATWESPRAIYDPGINNQTISNTTVVLPNGTLIDMFLEIDAEANAMFTSSIKIIRSTDNGLTWSAPLKIADNLAVGARDPDTGMAVRDSTLVPQIAVGPGGDLHVVWQDSRFSDGAHDAIAYARSIDGGMTWSAPARVNSVPGVVAFSPSIHVRSDGVVGISYYDFRDNTASTATLLTGYWLARSANGTQWQESRLAGPFDLTLAPLSDADGGSGYFLGDYQALLSSGNVFMPLFVQTVSASDRTDVFIEPAVSAATAIALTSIPSAFEATAALRNRVSENIVRARQAHLPTRHSFR